MRQRRGRERGRKGEGRKEGKVCICVRMGSDLLELGMLMQTA